MDGHSAASFDAFDDLLDAVLLIDGRRVVYANAAAARALGARDAGALVDRPLDEVLPCISLGPTSTCAAARFCTAAGGSRRFTVTSDALPHEGRALHQLRLLRDDEDGAAEPEEPSDASRAGVRADDRADGREEDRGREDPPDQEPEGVTSPLRLLETLPDPILHLDPCGRVLAVHSRAASGREPHARIGSRLFDHLEPEDARRLRAALQAAARSGAATDCSIEHPVHGVCGPLRIRIRVAPGGEATLRLRDPARPADGPAGRLDAVRVVAHDLANVMTAILAYVELSREAGDAGLDDPLVDGVRRAARRGAALTRHLIDLAAAAQPDAPHAPGGDGGVGSGPGVLVVDDEPPVRDIIARGLRALGYRVDTAADGAEALARIDAPQGARYDAVVTDIDMPRLDGRELADALRVRRPDLPIVFVSGRADDGAVLQAELVASTAFLEKPFSAAELGRTLRGLLDASVVVPDAG